MHSKKNDSLFESFAELADAIRRAEKVILRSIYVEIIRPVLHVLIKKT